MGKVDPGLRAAESPPDISQVATDACWVEEPGYDGLVTEETTDDPYGVRRGPGGDLAYQSVLGAACRFIDHTCVLVEEAH